MVANPILVAIDTVGRTSALALARATADHVGGFKVGLGLLHAAGPTLIGELRELGRPVFADAKLHDIPTQVERAAGALGRAGARWITVHASGGAAMVAAAVSALNATATDTAGVLAVSVLTSLDTAALQAIGITAAPEELVEKMARLADANGAEGLVCSPHEVRVAKRASPRLIVVTPGIRPAGSAADDQRRSATPGQARSAGADWLVIGRPITSAADPAAAAAEIAAGLMAP